MRFMDRMDAGKQLAAQMRAFSDKKDAVVIGLVRGGVATAYAIAQELHLPLGVMSVKKVGAPYQPELALGAVCADGSTYFNPHVLQAFGYTEEDLKPQVHQMQAEAEAKLKRFIGASASPSLKNRTAILVDDGLATGATMMASIASARKQGAAQVVVAVPVAAQDSLEKAQEAADQVICLYAPAHFMAVGEFYVDFSQVEDEEVLDYLTSLEP